MDAELRHKVARVLRAGTISNHGLKGENLYRLTDGVGPIGRDTPSKSEILERLTQYRLDALAPILAEVEAAARADEREKAAALADAEVGNVPDGAGYNDALADIAAAIRAQKEPTT